MNLFGVILIVQLDSPLNMEPKNWPEVLGFDTSVLNLLFCTHALVTGGGAFGAAPEVSTFETAISCAVDGRSYSCSAWDDLWPVIPLMSFSGISALNSAVAPVARRL